MLRVRFPNGQCIQYNDVVDVEWQTNGGAHLLSRDAAGKRWINAQLAPGTQAVLEWVRTCAVSNPITGATPEQAVATVKQHLRTLPTRLVKELKLSLRPFNAKRHTWKD